MGKNFDGLVEIVKKSSSIPMLGSNFNLHKYLGKSIENLALFELPVIPDRIRPKTDEERREYGIYINDYFELSRTNGHFFIMPFKVTAVEDAENSVVIMESIGGKKFRVTTYLGPEAGGESYLFHGIVEPTDVFMKTNVPCALELMHTSIWKNSRMERNLDPSEASNKNYAGHVLVQSAIVCIEEIVYIMDPSNFIIERESKQSVHQRIKETHDHTRKQKVPYKKTNIRPHYICKSENEIKDFFRNEVEGRDTPVFPVRGHWRRLQSDYYKNKKGQTIYIPQFFKGSTYIETKSGWNYTVLIKENPTSIVRYSE